MATVNNPIITSETKDLDQGEYNPTRMMSACTYFVTDAKIVKNLCKYSRQVNPRMVGGHLDKIEQHRNGNTILLKVDSDCNIHLVIWRCPRISGEIKCSIMLLVFIFKMLSPNIQ